MATLQRSNINWPSGQQGSLQEVLDFFKNHSVNFFIIFQFLDGRSLTTPFADVTSQHL